MGLFEKDRYNVCIEQKYFHSTSAGRRALITKFPDHAVESVGFGRIAVVTGGEFADGGLQSRNTGIRIG